ncbi:uncharacterized protein A4U43_C06F18170 [Asparagus officinalis]|uniref:Uncharacterized protein n=1 Tax=Asparagus officinalis TaxID=4686 RepID=A0A5P1EML8_ASPOF|nr:uncharacterized protein A4U43_C06F18170 [Asparagus officinalis]
MHMDGFPSEQLVKKRILVQSKRSHMSEDTKDGVDGHATDSCDPFAFDEGEFEPSKWETLARKKSTSRQSTTNKICVKGCDDFSMDIEQMLSDSTTVDSHKSWEEDCPLVAPEDSNLVEDCLLAAVKVIIMIHIVLTLAYDHTRTLVV